MEASKSLRQDNDSPPKMWCIFVDGRGPAGNDAKSHFRALRCRTRPVMVGFSVLGATWAGSPRSGESGELRTDHDAAAPCRKTGLASNWRVGVQIPARPSWVRSVGDGDGARQSASLENSAFSLDGRNPLCEKQAPTSAFRTQDPASNGWVLRFWGYVIGERTWCEVVGLVGSCLPALPARSGLPPPCWRCTTRLPAKMLAFSLTCVGRHANNRYLTPVARRPDPCGWAFGFRGVLHRKGTGRPTRRVAEAARCSMGENPLLTVVGFHGQLSLVSR